MEPKPEARFVRDYVAALVSVPYGEWLRTGVPFCFGRGFEYIPVTRVGEPKSLVTIEFVARHSKTFWNDLHVKEYGSPRT